MGQQSRQSHESSRDFSGYETQATKAVSAAAKRGGDTQVFRRLRELTHSEDYSTTFTQWERQIQTFNPNFQLPNRSTPMDIQEVRIQLNKATKLLWKIQKNATMSRASHKNVQKLSHAQFKEKRARAFMANFARYSNPLTIPAYHRFKFLNPPCKFIRRAEPGQVHSVLRKEDFEQLPGMGYHYHKRGYRSSSPDLQSRSVSSRG
ncbi:hypothetical protein MHU86_7539 [Fragilaria crotonensis]|nr:hypothetical protein MHU86_7539 [Fragilaria crotonensis]